MTVPLVREWVDKAEQDWAAVQRLLGDSPETVVDVIGYLSQQTAEKYLKACLLHLGQEPEWIHDLGALLDRVTQLRPALEFLREDAEALTPLAVRFRYPGSWLTLDQAREGVAHADRIRAGCQGLLRHAAAEGLQPEEPGQGASPR